MVRGHKAARRWCFTLNNYTDSEVADIQFICGLHFSYLLYGKETAASGTPHLQGYFEFEKQKGLSYCKNIPGLTRAAFFVAKGSAKQNRTYCGKDAEPFIYGTPMEKGKRTDLIAVKRKIDEGITDVDLWDHHFSTMVHNHRALKVYKKLISKPRDFVTRVLVFVGPTDTHKSHMAHILGLSGYFGSFFVVPSTKGSGLYFDGYDDQDCILIDEMDGNRCTPTFLNSLCDRYEFSVPVHGSGNVNFRASTIIICSNYVPKDWWKTSHNIKPFMRRITLAWFTGPKAPDPYFINHL